MDDGSEDDDYMATNGSTNEPPSRLSFEYLCKLLDPKHTETPLWHKIIDRAAHIMLFFQIDYESSKPRVSRCVRLTREKFSNLHEFLEVAVFFDDRELPASFVESFLGRSYLHSTEELTQILDEVESADLAEFVEQDEDCLISQSQFNRRLDSDPAIRALKAVLGETHSIITPQAVSKDVPQNYRNENQYTSTQRKNNRHGLEQVSSKQQVETHVPLVEIPEVVLGLPQLSDDEDGTYSDRGSMGGSPEVETEIQSIKESLKPLLFPVKRKQDDVLVSAPLELNLGVVQALIPLPTPAPVSVDFEDSFPESPPKMSRANNSSKTYYWGAPGEDKVALHPGYLIYIYRNILDDLKDQFGPGKRNHWSKYAHRLAVHLLGGWGKILKNDKCRNGFEGMLGGDFFKALAGHVHQVFNTEVTKEDLLDRLDKTLKTCLERHTARKPARPKPTPRSAPPVVKLKVLSHQPAQPSTSTKSPSPAPCILVYEKPTRSLRSPTKVSFSGEIHQDENDDSDRDPNYDPDKSDDDCSEKSEEPLKVKADKSAVKTHRTEPVENAHPVERSPEKSSAKPVERLLTKKKKFYWINAGEDTVPLRVGYNVHVYRGILEDLQSQYGPGKNPWYTYAQKLVLHLIGGWETYIKDTGVNRSPLFDKYLGSPFLLAIIGHVQEFFNIKITKETILTKLTCSVVACKQKMCRQERKRNGTEATEVQTAGTIPTAKPPNRGTAIYTYEGESLEKYYWSTPGEDKVPLCPGYNIYVNQKILEEIGRMFGPPKTAWGVYMHRLAKHLLGGWDTFLKDKRPGMGLVRILGEDFFVALAGHLQELFKTTVTRNSVVQKLKLAMSNYKLKMQRKEKEADET